VLSYSLYLAHHVVLNVVGLQITASPLPKACAALAISMLIAWAIHQLVEKPCAALRKKLSAAATGGAKVPWRPGHAVTT
jgi:peptidoglycan/LPS O-acetylase OafA/YrhL